MYQCQNHAHFKTAQAALLVPGRLVYSRAPKLGKRQNKDTSGFGFQTEKKCPKFERFCSDFGHQKSWVVLVSVPSGIVRFSDRPKTDCFCLNFRHMQKSELFENGTKVICPKSELFENGTKVICQKSERIRISAPYCIYKLKETL